ncbi:MAG: CBS domain-containing protein [Anaerolineales bacterium]
MKVSDILASKGSEVFTIFPNQTIKEAVQLMETHNVGGLVVINRESEIQGIITERDLIRYFARNDPTFSAPVELIMTKKVIIGVLQDDIDAVAHTMTEKRFRHLPIVEDGKLIGILSIGDVVKAQRDRYVGVLQTLQIQISAEEQVE